MAKLWGPLGWMTLHSVSFLYPENPTLYEQHLASKFIDSFANTISCPQCRTHFITMREYYVHHNPDYLKSRQSFAVFVFRAHNTVNRRLDKPIPKTVADCILSLRLATSQRTLRQYREAYISYLFNNWQREFGGDAMVARSEVRTLEKIMKDYWDPRDDGLFPALEEEDIVTSIDGINVRLIAPGKLVRTDIGFKSGKLRLIRR
jgi:hypothetical protein